MDQKYEKVGTVSLKSRAFDEEEKELRAAIAAAGGLVQFEQSSGLEGKRSLHLAAGVAPEKFDTLIAKIRSIGELASIRIDKVDKTNEYKALQAKKASLEATKSSLLELKTSRDGSIEEFIQLESKIIQTESEIQDLGVDLGDFDEENEFCTVKVSLLEVRAVPAASIPLSQRIKVAIEWTASILGKLAVIAFAGTAAFCLAVLLFTWFRKTFREPSEEAA